MCELYIMLYLLNITVLSCDIVHCVNIIVVMQLDQICKLIILKVQVKGKVHPVTYHEA